MTEPDRRQSERAEGEWTEYQRLVLTELERHGTVLSQLPAAMEALRAEVSEQRHDLAQVQTIIQTSDLPGVVTLVRDHEKRIAATEAALGQAASKTDLGEIRQATDNLARKEDLGEVKEDVRGLKGKYYAVLAGLLSALVILVAVIVKIVSG